MALSMSISVAADEKPQPHAKRLKRLTPLPLPIEMALNCLARVSKSEHASLSLVSKWHRRQLISPELYEFRSLLGFTENVIYLCLLIPPEPNPRWFALFPKTQNRPRRLVQVRSTLYQPPEASSVVAHGCGIYVIGGRRISGRVSRSSSVYHLDCRSHKWTTLPSMRVPRESAAAGVVDGKIYVLGGSKDSKNPGNWGEVFDPKTQTWGALPVPVWPAKYCNALHLMYESCVMEEKKVFAEDALRRAFFYVPSAGKWKRGNKVIPHVNKGLHLIDKVMYSCVPGGRVMWCEASELECLETEVIQWREVMGLEALRYKLRASRLVNYGGVFSDTWKGSERFLAPGTNAKLEPDDILAGHKLSNSGPNMLIFWDVLAPQKLEIWCAEISLERRKGTGEIWGNVEWSEAVMTRDPPPPHHMHCKNLHSLSQPLKTISLCLLLISSVSVYFQLRIWVCVLDCIFLVD